VRIVFVIKENAKSHQPMNIDDGKMMTDYTHENTENVESQAPKMACIYSNFVAVKKCANKLTNALYQHK